MNYPTAVQSLTGGTRCQSAPSVSETKQGSGAAQCLRGQSSSTASFTGDGKWTYVFYIATRVE